MLAIPSKRRERRLVGFVSHPEVDALLSAPKRNNWLGRRDPVLLLMAVQTGLRLSEITALLHHGVVLGRSAHVRCEGKGRKERCTPFAAYSEAIEAGGSLKSTGSTSRRSRMAFLPSCWYGRVSVVQLVVRPDSGGWPGGIRFFSSAREFRGLERSVV